MTMADSLKKAGVKLPPVNQRVWTFLKDSRNPMRQGDIAKGVGMSRVQVSRALSHMVDLGTVKRDTSDSWSLYSALGTGYKTPPPQSVLTMTPVKVLPYISPEQKARDFVYKNMSGLTLKELNLVHAELSRFLPPLAS